MHKLKYCKNQVINCSRLKQKEESKSSTHYLDDKNRFDVLMLISATYTGHVLKFVKAKGVDS